MKWSEVPVPRKFELAELYKGKSDLTDVAAEMGMNPKTLRRSIQNFLEHERLFRLDAAQRFQVPDSPSPEYLDYEVVEGDDWLIISDIEIPDHHAEVLKLAMLVAMKKNIRRCIIAGDLVATDQSTMTRWVKSWKKDTSTSYLEDISIARRLISTMRQEWFTEVIAIEGNHDARIAKSTSGELHLGALLDGSGVKYSRYPYLYIKNHRGYTKVIHPGNFSQDPVTLAQFMYNAEQGPTYDLLNPRDTLQKCHIILAHCHRMQRGFSPDGAYEMLTMGTCRDQVRTQYLHQGATKHKKWDSGFMTIENGHFYQYGTSSTDWQRELGELYGVFWAGREASCPAPAQAGAVCPLAWGKEPKRLGCVRFKCVYPFRLCATINSRFALPHCRKSNDPAAILDTGSHRAVHYHRHLEAPRTQAVTGTD